MIAVVFASIATAAPTFEADRPEDAALAAVAWEAATECAGRPGASAAKVPIRRGYGQEGAIQALATWDGKGLAAIDPETLETRFRIETATGRVLGSVPSPGLHLAHNAAAAVAVARALRVPTDQIGPLLGQYAPVGMRLRIEEGPGQIRVINDAYNANPMSMVASLQTLCSVPRTGHARRIALLGDMLELGPSEIAAHREIIDLAQTLDLDILGLAGPLFAEAAGDQSPHLLAEDARGLARLLKNQLKPGDVVLLKGSRGLAMERVLSALQTEAPA